MANTIIIKRYSDVQMEFAANAAITPGMLVQILPTNKIRAHADAGKNIFPMFAIEDVFQGKGINDNYAAAALVRCWIPGRGDIVNALLRDEENVVIGDYLESDGEGRLRKITRTNESWESADAFPGGGQHSIYTEHILGIAIEAKDLSIMPEGSDSSAGGAYHNPRIQIMIL